MIDFSRLNDQSYLNSTLSDIKDIPTTYEVDNIIRFLAAKVYKKEIDPTIANKILFAAKEREEQLKEEAIAKREGGKMMHFHPTSNTAVSNRRGYATIVFLVVNVALVTAMYTLLIASKLIG